MRRKTGEVSVVGPVDGIVQERKWPHAIPVTLWVGAAFLLSSVLVSIVLRVLEQFGVNFKDVNQNVYFTGASVAIYASLLLLTLGGPRLLKLWPARISYKRLLGLTRTVEWADIFFAVVAFVVYLAIGVGLIMGIAALVPGFNSQQTQDLGVSKTLSADNAVMVFLALVVLAPVAEEVIFRGFLFGTLRRAAPVWVAVVVTSLLFAAIHWQWNVSIDVFVMSIVSCFLRYKTGSLWASILLHMMKNGLAFYTLFITTNSIIR